MSAIVQAAARLLAVKHGRAVATRSSYSLAPDPAASFAIVPLRMVSEQFLYAVAFGDPDSDPQIVVSWNPLDRDAAFLEPFARALDAYLTSCDLAGRLPRVWLPHGAALDAVELLGYRYRTNGNVDAVLQRMGYLCRVLSDEAQLAGQQVVAVASDLLATHVATGQSPSEDRHLGALLAWIDPLPGVAIARAAAEAALEPAAAMLSRAADDCVEALHRRLNKRRIAERASREEVEAIVRSEARREWQLMARGRRAFWSLGLEHSEATSKLVDVSRERVAWRIAPSEQLMPGRGTLAARLDEMVYAQELAEYVAVEGDRVVRHDAFRAGRVVRGRILEREQPRPGYHPCTLRIAAEQSVLRVRRGSELQLGGTNVQGRVEAVATGEDGRVVLTLVVRSGVRNAAQLERGDTTELSEPAPADLRIAKKKIYRRMHDARDPRVFGTALPDGSPLRTAADLLSVAAKLRTR